MYFYMKHVIGIGDVQQKKPNNQMQHKHPKLYFFLCFCKPNQTKAFTNQTMVRRGKTVFLWTIKLSTRLQLEDRERNVLKRAYFV